MALNGIKGALTVFAIILAMVVLPTPGGPQRIMDGIPPDSMALRKTPFIPTKCS